MNQNQYFMTFENGGVANHQRGSMDLQVNINMDETCNMEIYQTLVLDVKV